MEELDLERIKRFVALIQPSLSLANDYGKAELILRFVIEGLETFCQLPTQSIITLLEGELQRANEHLSATLRKVYERSP